MAAPDAEELRSRSQLSVVRMAFEPISVFSHRIDPEGVAALLRSSAADVEVYGPDDDWTKIVVVFGKRRLFREARVLTLGHNAEYYNGPGWSKQVAGMQNYFSNFPDCSAKAEVMRIIRTFRFSLSVPQHDLDIDSSDDRLALVHAVCRHLDAAIFTPSSLRDAAGRVIIDAGGYSDPSAVLPSPPATTDARGTTADPPDDDEGDEYEPQPPLANQVARRSLVLTAVSARATLELDAQQIEDADTHGQRIATWIEEVGVSDELEPDEWKVLQRPVGTLDERSLLDSMWRVEGLAVLAWALGLHPLPRYDELVVPPKLYESIGLFDAEAGTQLLAMADLRSPKQLRSMQEHLLAFHWRMRDFSLRPQAMDFVQFSRDCWFGGFDIKQFRVIDGDLAIGESAISRAPKEAIQRARSIAMERHKAINWLMGYSRVYSETDTST